MIRGRAPSEITSRILYGLLLAGPSAEVRRGLPNAKGHGQ